MPSNPLDTTLVTKTPWNVWSRRSRHKGQTSLGPLWREQSEVAPSPPGTETHGGGSRELP